MNIRSHADLQLEFDQYAGWHVIIGDNGAGKSSLVRAIALALVGPVEAMALRQDWRDWLRMGESKGWVGLSIDQNSALDKRTGGGKHVKNYYVAPIVAFERKSDIVEMRAGAQQYDAKKYIWGTGSGWFSASYGPFRRFTGGNKDYEKLFYSNPKLAPHLTVFGEDVALTEALEWLQRLRVRELEGESSHFVLASIKRFVNESGLLPHGTQLVEVTSSAVTFVDSAGCKLPVEQLSDGYRSILSLTFELIRQMTRAYGEPMVWAELAQHATWIELPGVVLIDEIDAHLHPTWQRRIGQWFRKCFPKLQFIVTTHSPLICQAATEGSIWMLGKPATGGVRKIEGVQRDRLVYGSVLDALDTDLFGEDVARSDEARQMLERLAELNLQALRGKLSEEERAELEKLRRTFPAEADET